MIRAKRNLTIFLIDQDPKDAVASGKSFRLPCAVILQFQTAASPVLSCPYARAAIRTGSWPCLILARAAPLFAGWLRLPDSGGPPFAILPAAQVMPCARD